MLARTGRTHWVGIRHRHKQHRLAVGHFKVIGLGLERKDRSWLVLDHHFVAVGVKVADGCHAPALNITPETAVCATTVPIVPIGLIDHHGLGGGHLGTRLEDRLGFVAVVREDLLLPHLKEKCEVADGARRRTACAAKARGVAADSAGCRDGVVVVSEIGLDAIVLGGAGAAARRVVKLVQVV